MHIGMALAPGDVRDFCHNGLKVSFSTVRKIEGDGIELVSEVSGVSKEVNISDVCVSEDALDPFADFGADGLMLLESKVALMPSGQIFLIGRPK